MDPTSKLLFRGVTYLSQGRFILPCPVPSPICPYVSLPLGNPCSARYYCFTIRTTWYLQSICHFLGHTSWATHKILHERYIKWYSITLVHNQPADVARSLEGRGTIVCLVSLYQHNPAGWVQHGWKTKQQLTRASSGIRRLIVPDSQPPVFTAACHFNFRVGQG